MDKRFKKNLAAIAFGVVLFVSLNHLNDIAAFVVGAIKVFRSVIIGAVIAFILNVPVTKFSNFYNTAFNKLGKNPKSTAVITASVITTVICILAVIAIVCVVLIPQLADSVSAATAAVREKLPVWTELLKEHNINSKWITDVFSTLQHFNASDMLKNSFTGVTSTVISTISSTANVTVNSAVAVVIAFYILMCKEKLYSQFQKLTEAYLPEKISRPMYKLGHLTSRTYSDFFCGQCVEAVILGVLMFLSFSVFRLPYAGLVGVLTAVFSFIPYVGSFLSCAVVVLLTLITSPFTALIAMIVYFVVQFCENQFIYPRVVGRSVGLPPMWTLIAVLIGGSLFGIIGMIFFIPVAAVIYKLIAEDANARIAKKRTDEEQ